MKRLPIILAVLLFGLISCNSTDDDIPVVKNIPVESVSLNLTEFSKVLGAPAVNLTATVHPANATNQAVAWTSSNNNIATVENGTVTAVSVGTAQIMVITADGARTDTSTITVNPLPVECDICGDVDCETEHTQCSVCGTWDCEKQHIECEVCGAWDCEETHVQCPVCNEWDCETQHKECEVCGAWDCEIEHTQCSVCGAWDCEIEYTECPVCGVWDCEETHVQCPVCTEWDCEKQHIECEVCGAWDCEKEHIPIVSVTNVTLNRHSISLAVGESTTLLVTVLPRNAANQGVIWSSSDPTVAMVNNNGTVSAVSEGRATITVTTKCGGFTAFCTARVRIIPENSVLIDGVAWATHNVDMPGTFTRNPEDVGRFFQWNRSRAWTSMDAITSWDNSIPEGTTWERENDPCPEGWRVPTENELRSLRNSGGAWVTVNGRNGKRFFSDGGRSIFLPAAGSLRHTDGSLWNSTTHGQFWSSTQVSATRGRTFSFFQTHSALSDPIRSTAASVRCVAE